MFEPITVIPAAGESKRFREAGYRNPKPVLMVKNRVGNIMSMLAHVEATCVTNMIIAALPEGVQKPFDSRADVIHIEKTTGQADTIYQAVKNFMPTTPVIVADCDMILSLEDMVTIRKLLGIYDMVVAVTETFDPNASRVDQVPHPNRFVEKEPISQWGIVGVRAFNKAYLLKDALLTTLNDCKHRGVEPYISMAMNYYPGTRYAYVVRGFQDWGTPERLKESGAEIVDKGRN